MIHRLGNLNRNFFNPLRFSFSEVSNVADQSYASIFVLGSKIFVPNDWNNYTGDNFSQIRTSTDGVNWITETTIATGINVNYIAGYATGTNATKVLYLGTNLFDDTSLIMQSTNGINWSRVTSPFSSFGYYFRAVASNGNTWVIGGDNGRLAISTNNAVSFSEVTSNAGGNKINMLAYGNGIYMAACDGGTIIKSTDGVNWTVVTGHGLTGIIDNVAFGNGVFLFQGKTFTTDGTSWVQISNDEGCAFFANNYWLKAYYGKIWEAKKDLSFRLNVDNVSDSVNPWMNPFAYFNSKYFLIGGNTSIGGKIRSSP